jgi:hypothetical protein
MSPLIRSILNHRGALLFALLQAAPVDIRVNENGRFALAMGLTGDRYTQETFTCEGAPIDSRTVVSRTISGTVNVPVRGSWSIDAFGGETSLDGPVCEDAGCSLPPAFKGGFGGLRARVDGPTGAFAIGMASLPDVDIDYVNATHEISRELVPSMLIRVGSIEPGRRHFRVEVNGVPTPGAVPMTTFGVGFASKEASPVRGFLGLSIPPYSAAENGNLLLRGEMLIPLGTNAFLAVGASGSTSVLSGGAGLRITRGKGPR